MFLNVLNGGKPMLVNPLLSPINGKNDCILYSQKLFIREKRYRYNLEDRSRFVDSKLCNGETSDLVDADENDFLDEEE